RHERLSIEPILRSLSGEVIVQQSNLAIERCLADRLIYVRTPQVAVPLRNFVFQDHVIAKRVPGQLGDLAMVLVCVVAPVGEDYIGVVLTLQALETVLELGALIREVTVPEIKEAYSRPHSTPEKRLGRLRGLFCAKAGGT